MLFRFFSPPPLQMRIALFGAMLCHEYSLICPRTLFALARQMVVKNVIVVRTEKKTKIPKTKRLERKYIENPFIQTVSRNVKHRNQLNGITNLMNCANNDFRP